MALLKIPQLRVCALQAGSRCLLHTLCCLTTCRMHLYGDIYSSPGISMRQKQLLMAAFLAQANMHDQLFGHLIAVGLLV